MADFMELKSINFTVFELDNKIHIFNTTLLFGHTFSLYSHKYLIFKINQNYNKLVQQILILEFLCCRY